MGKKFVIQIPILQVTKLTICGKYCYHVIDKNEVCFAPKMIHFLVIHFMRQFSLPRNMLVFYGEKPNGSNVYTGRHFFYLFCPLWDCLPQIFWSHNHWILFWKFVLKRRKVKFCVEIYAVLVDVYWVYVHYTVWIQVWWSADKISPVKRTM